MTAFSLSIYSSNGKTWSIIITVTTGFNNVVLFYGLWSKLSSFPWAFVIMMSGYTRNQIKLYLRWSYLHVSEKRIKKSYFHRIFTYFVFIIYSNYIDLMNFSNSCYMKQVNYLYLTYKLRSIHLIQIALFFVQSHFDNLTPNLMF